tara:strand:+ start:59 stop:793 length:735 start_codon:yes stop_codon:yes gene_type:complete
MIFNLFKSKPTLKELIPEGFVDIHSHILPGIDDGAKNINESLELISEMKKLGFSKIIATPHVYPGLYENDNESIRNSFKKIKNKIVNEIEVSYSSEYMIDYSLIKKAEENTLLPIKENYVLIEMGFISAPNNLFEVIFQLQISGYKIILAHPERYRFLFNKKENLIKLKEMNCRFQINLLSSTGYYGNDILKNTDYLLKNNYVNYVGSDIHNMSHINYIKKNEKVKLDEIKEFKRVIENNIFFK